MLSNRLLLASRRGFSARLQSGALRSSQRRLASSESSTLKGAEDNLFNRERLAAKEHAAASGALWRKISIYVVIPAITLGTVNAWILWKEHQEHWASLPPLEERVEYPYQNIRTKNFPFGNGDETLFWNPKVNYHKKDE